MIESMDRDDQTPSDTSLTAPEIPLRAVPAPPPDARGSRRIVRLLRAGASPGSVARQLSVAPSTVYALLDRSPEAIEAMDKGRQARRDELQADLAVAGHGAISKLVQLMGMGDEETQLKAATALLNRAVPKESHGASVQVDARQVHQHQGLPPEFGERLVSVMEKLVGDD